MPYKNRLLNAHGSARFITNKKCYTNNMSITSTAPTSRRAYASVAEIAEYIGVATNLIDTAKVELAEQMIDDYVGYHEKYMENEVTGLAQASGSLALTLQQDQQQNYGNDYFKLCEVEIIGGAGAGQRRKVTGSTKAGVLTVDTAWATALDTTSYYRIYQLGKFPRHGEVTYESTNETYYKVIPEAIRRAVCAQYEFIVEMGDAYFETDKADMASESIGDYSYNRKGASPSTKSLIGAKAQTMLQGYVKRYGQIV